DPAAVGLWPDVADQVGRAGRVAVDVAIEAGHALAWFLALAVEGSIELLLGKLGDQQADAFQVLGVEDAAEDLLEVVDGDHLALGNVTQVGPGGQKDGRRELRQEVVWQVEV